jgi:hypothetical protein
MITNQKYSKPGGLSRALFKTLHGKSESTYAGKCIGPALNLLPEDDPGLPEVVPVEWLNTTCTIYRRNALKTSPFPDHFTGYSLLEDLALSLQVAKNWKLVNARTARIFHDTQPGAHKNSPTMVSKMWLVNRHYVMTQLLGKRAASDYLRLMLLETFGVVTPLVSASSWKTLPSILAGKLAAIWMIVSPRTNREVAVSLANERNAIKD